MAGGGEIGNQKHLSEDGGRQAGLLRKTVRPFLGKSDAELPHDPTLPTIPLETLCHLICMQNGVIPIYA